MKKKRKSDTVLLSVTGVNNQEYSPVINLVCDYPEIVIDEYKYPENSILYHIWIKDGKVVMSSTNESSILESSFINLSKIIPIICKYDSEPTLHIKNLVDMEVKEVLIDFIVNILEEGEYKNFRIDPPEYLESIKTFVDYSYDHLRDELGLEE